MRIIDALELHVAHSCNLTCESCSHYSNQGHEGLLSLDDAARWIELWSTRVSPCKFSLLGGEPTIHPQLSEFIPLVRDHWPDAKLELVTNGFLLPRHPQLPRVLTNDRNACIAVSIHHTSAAYRARLMPVVALLLDWSRTYGVRVEYRPSHAIWTRRYRGFGAQMQPFDDRQPRQSWEQCPAKYCMQLYDERLWKCPPVAYLSLQHAKYHLDATWQRYLAYVPLAPDCSDAELDAFLAREEEPCCGMCPARPERFAMPSPLTRNA